MDRGTAKALQAALIARLGAALPAELDRLALPQTMGLRERPSGELVFRFLYRDVCFKGRVSRETEHAVLRLVGDLGPMPYSIQAALRRRRALRTLNAASRDTGLDWRLTDKHCIAVTGEIALARQPLTPAAIVAGAVSLLVRGDRYLTLLLDVLGEADSLNSSQAA